MTHDPSERSAASTGAWDERRLVTGLLAQEGAAISEFLSRTHHAVYGRSCRLTPDPEDRQDWTHEVLLGILEDLRRGKFVYLRPGGFWAWFRQRAWFRLLDEYRRRRRLTERFVSESALAEASPPPDQPGTADPGLEFERARLRNLVETCLDRLTNADQRVSLQLLLLEEFTYEEIARATASPLNTVRAWIRRGRIALRLCVAGALGIRLKDSTP